MGACDDPNCHSCANAVTDAIQAERDAYRDALQEIAGADTRRTNAGWLRDIAQAVLDGREII